MVSQPVEPNNKKGNNNKKLVIIISIIAAGLVVIGVGALFLFGVFDDKDSDDYDYDDEIVEVEDDKEEETKEEKDEKDSKTVSALKYQLSILNTNSYDFNEIKKSSNKDTVKSFDGKSSKEVEYTFSIENGSVKVSNTLGSETTINKIKNAKELVVLHPGQTYTGSAAVVLTTDGKLYTVPIDDSKTNELITDCTKLENYVQEQQINETVKTISYGSYINKYATGGEGAILVTTNSDKQYIITVKSVKNINNDSDLIESYLKVNTKEDLEKASKKIADLFNSGLKTGKIEEIDKKQITSITLLYLEGKTNTCFSKSYFKAKVKELFGVEISDGDFIEKQIEVKDGYYCTTEYFSGVGGPAPEFDIKSSSSEKDGNVVYQYEYSYENNKTTITLEYKYEKDHYVLVSIDKK